MSFHIKKLSPTEWFALFPKLVAIATDALELYHDIKAGNVADVDAEALHLGKELLSAVGLVIETK